MLNYSLYYFTFCCHYLFCLCLVALLSWNLSSLLNSQTKNGLKANLEKLIVFPLTEIVTPFHPVFPIGDRFSGHLIGINGVNLR